MDNIQWLMKEEDIEWTMNWGEDAQKHGKPETEQIFEDEAALAHMLMNEVVFLNSHWWMKDWPEEARKTTSISVNCNDVFAWGCADAEGLSYDEIEGLYRMWRKDPIWGAAIWCMIKRNQMPQKPVEDLIRQAGIWDMDSLKLGENTMDREVKEIVSRAFANCPNPTTNQ